MPTKCSIAHGPDFLLYSESFDEEHVFLHLDNVKFEAFLDGLPEGGRSHLQERDPA